MNDLPVTIAAVRHAAASISGAIAHTPVVPALAISELAGAEIQLKLETLHRTGSFKERGALAKPLNPDIEIIGVQSTLYPSMYRLMHGEDPGPPAAAATLAEGIAVKEPGRLTRRIVEALVSDILLVDDVTIEGAVEVLLERQKLVVEGAGAAGLAAVLAAPERFRGRRVGIVICGGNIDARLLASILMRGLVREGRLVRLRSELPDIPGALSRLSGVIGKHSGNIVEVHHQRLFHDTSVKRAELDVVVETQNRRHVEVLIAALAEAGFPTQLLSSNGADERADCNAAHEDATRVGGRP